jgi:hypothetical protein
MRLALRLSGQTAKAKNDAQTIWADPETRNEAARTDSVLKQYAAGLVSDEFALELLGYSQTDIDRIAAQKKAARIASASLADELDAAVALTKAAKSGSLGNTTAPAPKTLPPVPGVPQPADKAVAPTGPPLAKP